MIELEETGDGAVGIATAVVTELAPDDTEPLELVAVTITLYVVLALNPEKVAEPDEDEAGVVGEPFNVYVKLVAPLPPE